MSVAFNAWMCCNIHCSWAIPDALSGKEQTWSEVHSRRRQGRTKRSFMAFNRYVPEARRKPSVKAIGICPGAFIRCTLKVYPTLEFCSVLPDYPSRSVLKSFIFECTETCNIIEDVI